MYNYFTPNKLKTRRRYKNPMFLPNPEAPIPSPFTTKDTIPSLFIIIIYIYSGLSRPKDLNSIGQNRREYVNFVTKIWSILSVSKLRVWL